MSHRVLTAALALVLAGPAAARAPRRSPHRVPTREVNRVLSCFGFEGLASHVARMTEAYAAPPTSKAPTDVAARALVHRTHTKVALVAAERRVVARLDPALLRAAAAFCRTRAGHAYGRLMNAGTSLKTLKTPPKPTAQQAALVETLVTETGLVDATDHENLLAVRNAAGARAMVDRAGGKLAGTQGARLAFLKGFRARVADQVKAKLGDHAKEMNAAVLHLVTISLARTPKGQVEAMVRFFRSRAGKAVAGALGDALEAAMDDAWNRMGTRFIAGRVGAQ